MERKKHTFVGRTLAVLSNDFYYQMCAGVGFLEVNLLQIACCLEAELNANVKEKAITRAKVFIRNKQNPLVLAALKKYL